MYVHHKILFVSCLQPSEVYVSSQEGRTDESTKYDTKWGGLLLNHNLLILLNLHETLHTLSKPAKYLAWMDVNDA